LVIRIDCEFLKKIVKGPSLDLSAVAPLTGIFADAGAAVALGLRALYDVPARKIEKR
jgi:hypothetical protein